MKCASREHRRWVASQRCVLLTRISRVQYVLINDIGVEAKYEGMVRFAFYLASVASLFRTQRHWTAHSSCGTYLSLTFNYFVL